MSLIDVLWDDDEKRILRWEYHVGWHWVDVEKAVHQTQTMLANIPYEVTTIHNINRTSVPVANALANVRSLMQLPPTGPTIIVNATGFGIQLVQIVMKAFRVREGKLDFADSLEDAYKLLSRHSEKVHQTR